MYAQTRTMACLNVVFDRDCSQASCLLNQLKLLKRRALRSAAVDLNRSQQFVVGTSKASPSRKYTNQKVLRSCHLWLDSPVSLHGRAI